MGLRVAKTWNGSGSECVCVPTVTRRSCIAWSSAACVFGGVRLISSARTRLWKMGPGRKRTAGALPRVVLQHVGPGDVGREQVRRELHAAEGEIERLGQRRDEQRLRKPRHAHEQRVPASEERDEHELDDVLLADDAHGDRLRSFWLADARHLEELDVARTVDPWIDRGQWRPTCSSPASSHAKRRPVKVC